MNKIIQSAKTAFFECDIQERFRPLIYQFPSVVYTAKKLIKIGGLINVPLLVSTEQYPKALGKTVDELNIHSDHGFQRHVHAEKTQFSMVLPEVVAAMKSQEIEHVVLFGIESHVCILQTALDLRLEHNINVHLIVDGISSSFKSEIPIALERLKQAGCHLTTSESLAFQLLGDASGEQKDRFKKVSALIKDTQSNSLHNSLL